MKKILFFFGICITYIAKAQEACSADVHTDGQVNILDIMDILNTYGTTCVSCNTDITNDNIVGVDDLLQVITWYGQPCNQQCIGTTTVSATPISTPSGIIQTTANVDTISLLSFTVQPDVDLPATSFLFYVENNLPQDGIQAFTLTVGNETFSSSIDENMYVWFDLSQAAMILPATNPTTCTLSLVTGELFDGIGQFTTPTLMEVGGVACTLVHNYATPITGESQFYYSKGIITTLTQTTVTFSGNTTTYVIEFEITAFGSTGGALISTVDGIQMWTSSFNYTSTLTTTTDEVFGEYYIEENATEVFTLTVTVTNASPGTEVGISTILYSLEFLGDEYAYPENLLANFTISNL